MVLTMNYQTSNDDINTYYKSNYMIGNHRSLYTFSIKNSINQYFKNNNSTAMHNVYQHFLSDIEKTLIVQCLIYTKQNKMECARILGINRGTLYKKLRHYDIG
jgi:Fis family transcriptional regulator, factor for inversion stimulation protein